MSSAAALQLPPRLAVPRLAPSTPPSGPRTPSRPALRVLEGGRSRQQAAQRAVFRRRRLAALAVVTALVVAVLLLASSALAGGAGGGVPSPATGGSAAPVVHVVQPGDTLWSIAGKVAPGADVRLTVDRLVELNGGAPLEVGDRLVLP